MTPGKVLEMCCTIIALLAAVTPSTRNDGSNIRTVFFQPLYSSRCELFALSPIACSRCDILELGTRSRSSWYVAKKGAGWGAGSRARNPEPSKQACSLTTTTTLRTPNQSTQTSRLRVQLPERGGTRRLMLPHHPTVAVDTHRTRVSLASLSDAKWIP